MIESVWENRFQYISELQLMGANIVAWVSWRLYKTLNYMVQLCCKD